MVVRAVVLDFGGTLAEGEIDWNEFHVAIQRTLKGLGHPVELDKLKKAIHGALAQLERVRARDEEKTLEEVYGSVLVKLGIPPKDETLEMIHDLFKRHYKQSFYPCVEEVLEKLSERYVLAVISNTMSDQPRLILEQTYLDRYFELVVCSRELGIRKPNPRIFEFVLDRLGVEPGEAIHVGDSVEADMMGALNAGVRPVWIKNQQSLHWTGDTITSICELPGFLEDLEDSQ
ncbi:MAG: HAD family hydrolase [Candidatus Bathyarchaeia archaeon]